MDFHNRLDDLKLLNSLYKKRGPRFAIMFGRRRVGKTRLLTHWLEKSIKTNYIYWVSQKTTSTVLLKSFSQQCSSIEGMPEGFSFENWEAAFKYAASLSKKKRFVLVLDEFTYLVDSDPSISSLLQNIWDHVFRKTNIFLIICGSHFNMMRKEFLDPKSPLFGRATESLLIDELSLDEMKLFLPKYSFHQLIETYSVVGGVPKYLEMWNDSNTVLKNVKDLILSPVTIFKNEPVTLIQEEIPDAKSYLSILDSIGGGLKTPKVISDITGIAQNHIGKYLNHLVNLNILQRTISAEDMDNPESRHTRYEIRDLYLRFFFNFIRPNAVLVEQHKTDTILKIIESSFESYVGKIGFETVCRNLISRKAEKGELPFKPLYIGRIWNNNYEIDIAAVDKKSRNILLGECKWNNSKVPESVFNQLKTKALFLKKLKGYQIHYALFSKSGFTKPLKKNHKNILLFDKF